MSSPQALTIWCNAAFPPAAEQLLHMGLGGHKLIRPQSIQSSNLVAGGSDRALEEADIAFGQPDPEQAPALKRLKWIHLTSAGYTRYDTPAFREAVARNGTAVCNSSSVYAEPCAQHVLAMMLALARKLPESLDNQRGRRNWPYLELRAQSRLLNGQTVLLVGYGAIARRLAELLAPFNMNIVGFRRRPVGDERDIRVLPIAQLDEWLGRADHVVNILPASAETRKLFDASRFAKMPSHACYYNIGRGTTNDVAAMKNALDAGTIASAYIDAFAQEPLPPDHPLWTTKNCHITPHTAGGHANEYERLVRHFLDNLQRYVREEPLRDRVM